MIIVFTCPQSEKSLTDSKPGRSSGFSLIEVVVAMSIFAIGILATMQMGLLAQRNITSGDIVSRAVLLGQSEIERIKGHSSLIKLQDTFNSDHNHGGILTVDYFFSDPLADEFESPKRENCETASFDGSGTCLAVVTVSWKRGGRGRGGKGQVQFRTLIHGGGA